MYEFYNDDRPHEVVVPTAYLASCTILEDAAVAGNVVFVLV